MDAPFPSIQSFFHPDETSPKKAKATSSSPPSAIGDGFTAEEADPTAHAHTLHKWQPPRGSYEEADIATLIPGPGGVALTGRVVNHHHVENPSKAPHTAKGCVRIVVKDNSAAIVVRLWYDKIDYGIRLGQLVSIWTRHVSNAEATSVAAQNATLMTSLFPEKDNSCYFLVQREGEGDDGTKCKIPLGYCDGKQLPGLMTLKSFFEGGAEVRDAKVLVCVKSVGGRKTFTTKKGTQTEKVHVGVLDDTANGTLEMWNSLAVSSCAWTASETVLLLSNPGHKPERGQYLTVEAKTHVDVDPHMADASWLKKFAQHLTKKDHINPAIPEGLFDVETALTAKDRLLFTLADIGEWAQDAPQENFMGWISLILMEMNLTKLHQRSMMFCNECCGLPLYANTTEAKCKQCDKVNKLRINPRVVGQLIDETGCIECGKLIWSDDAWEQLLGRSADELAQCSMELLKNLEARLLFLRYALFFGWSEQTGKIVAFRIRTL